MARNLRPGAVWPPAIVKQLGPHAYSVDINVLSWKHYIDHLRVQSDIPNPSDAFPS